MQIKCDTHLHTLLSVHAKGTVAQTAAAAAERGLEAIAITDHGSRKMCHFERSVEELLAQQLPRLSCGVRIYRGAEIDIEDYKGHLCFYNIPYDAERSALDRLLETREVVVASPHFLPEGRQGSYQEVTDMFLNLIANPHVTTLGHPARIYQPFDLTAVALAAAENGTFIECNNVSLNREEERETVVQLLLLCKTFGTQIVVNSDSHAPENVGSFTEAYRLLQKIDFPEALIANRSRECFEQALTRQRKLKAPHSPSAS